MDTVLFLETTVRFYSDMHYKPLHMGMQLHFRNLTNLVLFQAPAATNSAGYVWQITLPSLFTVLTAIEQTAPIIK